MMGQSQSDEIEKLQRHVMKVIYGHKKSYASALEENGLPTLAERKSEIITKFAIKLSTNRDFEKWFPIQEHMNYNLRKVKKFRKLPASTDWLYKSPLFTFRRILNETSFFPAQELSLQYVTITLHNGTNKSIVIKK